MSSIYVLFRSGKCVAISTDQKSLMAEYNDGVWFPRSDDPTGLMNSHHPDIQLVQLPDSVGFTIKSETPVLDFKEIPVR